MTGTTDDIVITMADIKQASINRADMTKATYVKVTMGLELYLMDVMLRMADSKNKTDLFAVLHTFFEIGIQAGIDAERKRIHDAVAAADEVDAAAFDDMVD
jgi:hypothetical protein